MSEKIIIIIETSEWVDVPEVGKAIDSFFGKKIVVSVKDAAQQSVHLTDGILRDLLVSLTPQQLSALKVLLTPPIGR